MVASCMVAIVVAHTHLSRVQSPRIQSDQEPICWNGLIPSNVSDHSQQPCLVFVSCATVSGRTIGHICTSFVLCLLNAHCL